MTLYSCATSSRYTMTATLYVQTATQDPDTGEFNREYVEEQVIRCYATNIAASGKDQPGTYENFYGSGIYRSTDFVRIYSADPIPKDFKVSKVITADGVLFAEDDNDGFPTIYDSNGSVLVPDASGRAKEYVTLLSRSEVQDGGIL